MTYRLLVVDDEELIREGLRVMVERLDLFDGSIKTAANGVEAYRIYKEFKPHVIITDIKMPETDGLELVKNIRESGDQSVKIAILSGYGDFNYARTAIKYGVFEYLMKPVNREEIAGLLRKLINIIQSEETVKESILTNNIKIRKGENPAVSYALEFIKENYNRDLTLNEVANHIHMNGSYFSTLFKKIMDVNFIDYLTNYRIEKAKELLMNSSLKVYEISKKVGYSSEKHFFKVFKKIVGISPNELRGS